MPLAKKARVVVGVLSALTLLGLIIAEFFNPELQLTNKAILILLSLISASLGIDMALEQFPIQISFTSSQDTDK